jgi:hypothetical protein
MSSSFESATTTTTSTDYLTIRLVTGSSINHLIKFDFVVVATVIVIANT